MRVYFVCLFCVCFSYCNRTFGVNIIVDGRVKVPLFIRYMSKRTRLSAHKYS